MLCQGRSPSLSVRGRYRSWSLGELMSPPIGDLDLMALVFGTRSHYALAGDRESPFFYPVTPAVCEPHSAASPDPGGGDKLGSNTSHQSPTGTRSLGPPYPYSFAPTSAQSLFSYPLLSPVFRFPESSGCLRSWPASTPAFPKLRRVSLNLPSAVEPRLM